MHRHLTHLQAIVNGHGGDVDRVAQVFGGQVTAVEVDTAAVSNLKTTRHIRERGTRRAGKQERQQAHRPLARTGHLIVRRTIGKAGTDYDVVILHRLNERGDALGVVLAV